MPLKQMSLNLIPLETNALKNYSFKTNAIKIIAFTLFFEEDLLGTLREGVYAPVGPDCLAHTRQRFINIVGLTALRLAFYMGYE